MRNLIQLKIAIVVSYLLIVFPGKLAVINGILIPVVFIAQLLEIFEKQSEFIKIWYEFVLLALEIVSFIFLFKRSKEVILMCFLVQYFLLFYFSKLIYLKYWYFTLPTSVYVILSLILLYFIFVKKQSEKTIDL
jgi:hypothetical protein